MGNWFKTTVLFAAILALFMMIGGLIGGREGMMMALLLGGGMNFFAYWFSDKMVLRMYNAREVDAASAPEFYGVVQELALCGAGTTSGVHVNEGDNIVFTPSGGTGSSIGGAFTVVIRKGD